jgi:nicotinamidase-related amidase
MGVCRDQNWFDGGSKSFLVPKVIASSTMQLVRAVCPLVVIKSAWEFAVAFSKLKEFFLMSNNTALLIIDAQVNMFTEGSSVFEGEKLLHTISRLIAQARTVHLPIVYVQNNGSECDPDMPGTPGWQIHPAVTPEKGDVVIQKHTPDSFYGTTLQNELEARQIHQVIIVGMQTEMCIDATCRRAHELGYEVTLVKDAHSTFDGDGITAAQIIAQYNDAFRAAVKVEEASSITFG